MASQLTEGVSDPAVPDPTGPGEIPATDPAATDVRSVAVERHWPPAKSGVSGLDFQLGGGIQRGSTVLLLSRSSNAPALFADQFVRTALQEGEHVYYYNLERHKSQIFGHMADVFAVPGREERFHYFDCYSVRLRALDHATLETIGVQNHAPNVTQDVLQRLLAHPRDAPFRLVIESLTETIDAYGLQPTLDLLKPLVGLVRGLGGIALLMLEAGVLDPTVEARVRHAVDGVIEFGSDRQGFGLYSFFVLSKMNGLRDAPKLLLYKETEQGLWVETTRRVI